MNGRYVCWALLVFGAWSGAVEDEKVAPKDYGAGFAKLHSLGLADVSQATYVKLDITSGHQRLSPGSYHDSLLYQTKRKGNAWLLKENKSGESLFIMGSGQPLNVYDYKQVLKEQQEKGRALAKEQKGKKAQLEMAFSMAYNDKVAGRWKPIAPADDLKKLIVYLEKLAAGKVDDPPWELRNGGAGKLFLDAALFYRKGFKDEANRLAALLFETAEDPRDVIVQAYETLAQGRYNRLYSDFLASADWQAYLDGMRTELKPFRGGWRAIRAIDHLCAVVEARIATGTPPPLNAPGDLSLSDEDHALARELADKGVGASGPFDSFGGQSWLLGRSFPGQAMVGDKESVIRRIQKRGLESLPLLIALLGDEYLVGGSFQAVGAYYSVASSRGREQSVQQQLLSIPHPASRGKVARALLQQVLPISDEERYQVAQVDVEGFRDDALAWYDANKGKSREELALGYLQEGNSEQKQAALQFLITQGKSSGRFAVVEEALLNDDQHGMNEHFLQQYVTTRGSDAKAFVERFAAGIEKPKKQEEGLLLNDDSDHMAKRRKQLLKQLRELVAAGSAEDLVAAYAKEEKTWQTAQPALISKLQQKAPEESLLIVLDGAVRAEEPQRRATLTTFATQVLYLRMNAFGLGMGYQGGFVEDAQGADKPLPIAPLAAQWRALLADERPTAGKNAGSNVDTTVAVRAAWALEQVHGSDEARAGGAWLGELPDRGRSLLRQRAHARLDGKTGDELPAFPNPQEVEDERRKALLAELTAATPEGVPGLLAKLTWSEKLALSSDIGENEELCRKLAPIAHRIVEVHALTGVADVDTAVVGLKGTALSTKTVEGIVEHCKGLVSAETPFGFTIRRCGAGHGVILSAQPLGTAAVYGRRPRMPTKQHAPAVRASLSARTLGASANWAIAPKDAQEKPAEEPAKKSAVDDMDALLEEAEDDLAEEGSERRTRVNKQFWENLEKLLAGEGNPFSGAEITFRCYNPAVQKKLAEAAAQRDGEDASGGILEEPEDFE